MNEKAFINLVTFWRDVEALSPQEIPKKAPNDQKEPTRDWGTDSNPPWLDQGFKRRPITATRMWRHSVYAATYDRPRFIDLLEQRLGKQPDVFEERPGGQSCVFSIAFDENGRPLVETMMISMAAWAFGIVESQGLNALTSSDACDTSGLHVPDGKLDSMPTDSGFPGFDIQLDRLREELAWRLGHLPEKQPIDQPWFADFLQLVIDKLKLGNLVGADPVCRVKSVQIRRPKKEDDDPRSRSDDDFLNSFFIKDLNRLIAGRLAKTGEGLRRYLEPPQKMARIDVRKDRGRALELLHPLSFPDGCWPAEHPLVWSQQVAINAMWKELVHAGGTFAVNGPPGTGKTTLLRDVVAAIVVDRAVLLANRGASLLGDKRTLDIGGRTVPYYALDPALSGFSIVVASSNNGAVENISLELPKDAAIHDIWSGKVDAYRDIAGELIDEPAWAMIAGRLGNKGNRTDFVSKFWWQKGETKEEEGKEPEIVKVAGLRERLDAIKQGKAAPGIRWADAVAKFNEALTAEQAWRRRIAQMTQWPGTVAGLRLERGNITESRGMEVSDHDDVIVDIEKLGRRIEEIAAVIKRINRRSATLRDTKPGFLEWISTFGKSHRQWRSDLRKVMEELEKTEMDEASLKKERTDYAEVLDKIKAKLATLDRQLADIEHSIEQAETALAGAKQMIGAHWPDLSAPDHDQERSSPWAHPDWRAARIRVFIAAMNLHRAFVEENAWKMIANLGIAMDMLGGGIPDPKVRAIALESLALVCPAISTTFASVATLFGDLGPETIGWLLIDEAGQATPQAAAGAIWRAKRIVVVGDPLQLEPVVTLPRTIEASLAACNGAVDNRWHPSRTSVQMLSDQTTPIGTTVGEGDDGIWVGAPLRVHRRCDDPMFSVSNAVAYDGLMVHQKKPSAFPWPSSAWIDVPKASGNGNWIPAEGDALRQLLQDLLRNHHVPADDIFLISPFREVVRELRGIGHDFKLDYRRVGTVHTTQGKEADVVIMVLGGGTGGARDWAASKPNLLNVAASRAKARLYVIGDRADWAKRRHFDVLARELKVHQ